MNRRVVNATEFKAKCLAILDEVADGGATVTVTKRGRPVATVGPAKKKARRSPAGLWAGKIKIAGDIVSADASEMWDVVRRR